MAGLNFNNPFKLYCLKICVAEQLYIYVYTNTFQHTLHESLNSFPLGNYINFKLLVPHKNAIEIDFLLPTYYEQHKVNRVCIKLI